jgi:hypothetical protein
VRLSVKGGYSQQLDIKLQETDSRMERGRADIINFIPMRKLQIGDDQDTPKRVFGKTRGLEDWQVF